MHHTLLHTRRRKGAAWLLLAVFVPMLLLTSLHRHEAMHAAHCSACVTHQPHAGHISQASTGVDVCWLCQLLTLPCLVAAVVRLRLWGSRCAAGFTGVPCVCVQEPHAPSDPRGPPFRD